MLALQVKNLKKVFNKKTVAVDNINFEIRRGEIVGLLGPNGAGKTTTVKMIASLLKPTSGRILIEGLDITKNRKRGLKKVSAVLEGSRNIYWFLTPRQNIDFFANAWGFSTSQIKHLRENLLKKFDLYNKADTPTMYLSKGMQQKVAISCSLVRNVPLLLLDEPTLGLDVVSTIELKNILREIAKSQNRTILLTSHNMKVIQDICDRVIIINKGKIVADSSVNDLISMFSGNFYKIIMRDELPEFPSLYGFTIVKKYKEADSVIYEINFDNTENLYDFIEFLKRNNLKLVAINRIEPDLEYIFIKFIKGEMR